MSVTHRLSTDGVAEVRLTNPERRNALGFATLDAIVDAIDSAQAAGARAIVFAADGPVFSAGADFADLTGTSDDVRFDDAVSAAVSAICRSHVPVIASVQGPCFGAAVDLVLAVDIVVAVRGATFQIPAARLGLLYNPAAIARLHGRVPSAMLRRLLLGVSVDADAAVAGGLIAASVAEGELATATADIATQIAAGHPDAVEATKALLDALDTATVDLDHWQARRLRLLDSDERHTAIAQRHQRATP
jgi:enoyl-CoA hydratase